MIANIIRISDVRTVAVVFAPDSSVALVLDRIGGGWVASYGINPATQEAQTLPACFKPTQAVLDACDAAMEA